MIEKTILREMMRSEGFARRAGPHLKREYFVSGSAEQIAYDIVSGYIKKYNDLPSAEAVAIDLTNRMDLPEDTFRETGRLFQTICNESEEQPNQKWLLDETEAWCRDKALHNAFTKGLQILQDKGEAGLSRGALPKMFQDALAVTFQTQIGHDYFDDAGARYDLLRSKHRRIPFDLSLMNRATKGGLLPKTLNVVMAVAGAGKSLFMAHCAANNLMDGRNVLYFTLELSEEAVSNRIDANLMNLDLGTLEGLPRDLYMKKIADIRAKTPGRLKVKEYAPNAAGSAHFRAVLDELRVKQNFVPDIIYVDYLNICQACTLGKGEHNSYERVKAVAEELRGIGVEFNVPVFTATQTNRSGYNSNDVGMENTSDSLGLPMTADLMFALVASEELDRLGQYMVIQLKSRYDDINRLRKFYLGVDKPKMKLYDTEQTAQEDNSEVKASAPNVGVPPRQGPAGGFAGFR